MKPLERQENPMILTDNLRHWCAAIGLGMVTFAVLLALILAADWVDQRRWRR